ncbi:MAG: SDR family oxidoreductase [Thermoleophilia bacterium]|nr:SDR family oxidoreductase [Thermoleophilia bacterium]
MSDALAGAGQTGGAGPMSRPIGDLRDPMDVSGQYVVVTGGGSGIGEGVAQAFAQRGATVAVLDMDVEGGRAAVERLRQSGGDHVYVECNIADRASVRAAVDSVSAAFGRIDVLVNNAGISAVKPFIDMDDDLPEWHKVIDVDLHGTANMTHAVANAMRAAGQGGLIVNISSVGGARCAASRELPMTGYVASKSAMIHLTTSWAIEFAEYNIRVNCILPGPTHSKLDAQLTPEYEAKIADGMLDRRYGEPLEIGALCVFMASREGAHLDGVAIPHDGGFLCIN